MPIFQDMDITQDMIKMKWKKDIKKRDNRPQKLNAHLNGFNEIIFPLIYKVDDSDLRDKLANAYSDFYKLHSRMIDSLNLRK